MTTPEIMKRFRRSPAAVKLGGLFASLSIISGCGDSSKLSDCPPEYYRDHAPVSSKIFGELQHGVSALRAQIRSMDTKNRYEYVSQANINPRYRDVAKVIFYQGLAGDAPTGSLGIGIPGTKVDERDEVLCAGAGGEYFLTQGAEVAIADLHSAGIAVSAETRQPSR